MVVQVPWQQQAEASDLLVAVADWRDDSRFLEAALPRLPETLRVNTLRHDAAWTAELLAEMGGERLDWPGVEAWRMPWRRGAAPTEHAALYQALHDSGRTTRQEAASMLPPLLLDAKPGDLLLDLCAAPGSKATQMAEIIRGSGAVIANEKSPQRTNTLVTNSRRLALPNVVVTRHDGRNMPRPPEPGYDAILVDAPCTGSGTTRKNPEVWRRWRQVSGWNLHGLQVELLEKAVGMVRPGGRVVYSTCSLDPVENEAVVCEVLRRNPWLEVARIDEAIRRIPQLSPGLPHWPVRPLRPLLPSAATEDRRGSDGEGGAEVVPDDDSEAGPGSLQPPVEVGLREAMAECGRIWPNDDPTGLVGGFFFAVLRQTDDPSTENRARCLQQHPADGEVVPPSNRHHSHDIREADSGLAERLQELFGVACDSGDLWRRGRRALWTHPDVGRLVHGARLPAKHGRWHSGGQWRPMQVVLAGLPALRVGGERIERLTSDALHALPLEAGERVLRIEAEAARRMVEAGRLPIEEVDERLADMPGGGVMLLTEVDGIERRVPVWKGEWLTPMWRSAEEVVLRAAFGLEPKPPEVDAENGS